jgi:Ca-activated chloride channel family protein
MKYFLLTLLSLITFNANNIEVKGKLIDAKTGDPVAFATVSAENSPLSTITSADGIFSLSVPEKLQTIICSAPGYVTQKIKIGKNIGQMIIKMQPEKSEQEVVVTGFGSHKQRRIDRSTSASPIYNNHLNNSSSPEFNTEDYDAITENRFLETSNNPLSTFSIDVDGASYSNVRRFLNSNQLPPAGSVRVEELINYFHYKYPQPRNDDPFSINTEAGICPWNPEHRLVMIGLQGKKIPTTNLPSSNLVFLIDVSGSMMDENKLPLVKSSMKLLTEQLREQDRVSIVVYAGNAGMVLPSTSGVNKQKIRDAIESLEAGGSTAGGEGIKLAYKIARQNFMADGNNRVILCTDGDFNVGASSDAEMEKLIEHERESGMYLTVLGYGMGNYKDSKMQKLADKGNGNHAYIDNITEAKKVLVNEFGGTLFTIAKDVKLQVEFNPAKVQAYRLVGYENRMLHKEDFNNDKKDAGDLGSGHTVTALYEVIPVGVKDQWVEKTDPLRYQQTQKNGYEGNEVLMVRFRYKTPGNEKSRLIEHPVEEKYIAENKLSVNFRFVTAVAQFGMLLSNSEFRQSSSFASANRLASGALGTDEEGYRAEFITLLQKAAQLSNEEVIGRK